MSNRAPLQIVPYDAEWPRAFGIEHDRIATALGVLARRIDHHGSTAVPGLAAKPIIDIQISVTSLQPLGQYAALLARLGYTHVPHPDDERCPFFYRPVEGAHTHHVHVVAFGGDEERRTLAFRDYLRDHSDTRHEYERLKRDLARRYETGELATPDDYASAKTEFVAEITDRALAAGYPQ